MPAQFEPLPSECLVDETVAIRLRGLPADGLVTLRLCNAGASGTVFMSHATFASNAEGVVDLTTQAPISGSYSGIDPMGLFWSRCPVSGAEVTAYADVHPDPLTVTLVAAVEGAAPISQAIKRKFSSEGVTCRDLREDGLVGKMFEPAGPGPFPTILVVGGSGGGLNWSQEMAGLLASHGVTALALAYFALEGLPLTLDRVPLEYFGRALDWLAKQPRVASTRIGVTGHSRGGELALLLGATYLNIKAVVAYAPSGVVWPSYPPTGHSAWSIGGKEVPYANVLTHEQWDKAVAEGRARADGFGWYLIPLQDEAYAEAASISVERINGPVLLISGQDDCIWPSTELTKFAVRRFKAKNFAHRVEHLIYPGAGHSIAWPNAPTTVTKFKHSTSGEEQDSGGSPEGTAHARQDSWLRMLAFIRVSLA